jgi:hypothetical protein
VALMPDGRFPTGGIPPHLASISVNTADLLDIQGWDSSQVTTNDGMTELTLRPSRIEFPADAGKLSAPGLEETLGYIPAVEQSYRVGFGGSWIAMVELLAGDLRVFRWPGSPPTADAELLTSWTVPYDDKVVTIRATERKGWPTRTITIRNGSSVALINMSRGVPGDHFPLYQELSVTPVTLTQRPPRDPSVQAVLSSNLALFQAPHPASGVDGGGCSPTTAGSPVG